MEQQGSKDRSQFGPSSPYASPEQVTDYAALLLYGFTVCMLWCHLLFSSSLSSFSSSPVPSSLLIVWTRCGQIHDLWVHHRFIAGADGYNIKKYHRISRKLVLWSTENEQKPSSNKIRILCPLVCQLLVLTVNITFTAPRLVQPVCTQCFIFLANDFK